MRNAEHLLLVAYLAHPHDACLTTFVVIKLTICLLFVTYLANKRDTCPTPLFVEKLRTCLLVAYLAHPRDTCLTTFVVIERTMCLLLVAYLAHPRGTCLTTLVGERLKKFIAGLLLHTLHTIVSHDKQYPALHNSKAALGSLHDLQRWIDQA